MKTLDDMKTPDMIATLFSELLQCDKLLSETVFWRPESRTDWDLGSACSEWSPDIESRWVDELVAGNCLQVKAGHTRFYFHLANGQTLGLKYRSMKEYTHVHVYNALVERLCPTRVCELQVAPIRDGHSLSAFGMLVYTNYRRNTPDDATLIPEECIIEPKQ